MHIASTLLLASVAVATCDISSSEASGHKPMDVEHLASDRSAVGKGSAATANRLLRASDAMDGEDRMLSGPVLASATTRTSSTSKKLLTIEEILDDFDRPVSTFSSIYRRRFELANENLDKLKALGAAARRRFRMELLNSESLVVNMEHALDKFNLQGDEKQKKARDMVIVMTRMHDSERQADEAHAQYKMDAPGWIASKKSINDVFKLLDLKEEGGFIFATPKLEVLKMYIEAYNKTFKEKPYTLLDALIEGFGSEVKVARILSFAHMSDLYKIKAKVLRDELFSRWLNDGVSVDNLFAYLGIEELGTKGLKYEELDILHEYIDLLNKKYPSTPTHPFGRLRKALGDREYAIQIIAGLLAGQKSEMHLNYLIGAWQKEQIRPDELYARVFKTANADELKDGDEAACLEIALWMYHLRWKKPKAPQGLYRDASDRSRKANKRGNPRSDKRPSK